MSARRSFERRQCCKNPRQGAVWCNGMIQDLRVKETKGAEEAYGGTDNTEPAIAFTFGRDGGLSAWVGGYCRRRFGFLELRFDA